MYATKCPIPTCGAAVEFTDIIVKDVMTAGLVDEEIKKEVLGWAPLDEKDVDATVTLIEAKEMARDALNRPLSHSAVSSYKKKKFEAAPNSKGSCKACGGEMEKYVWNQRQGRMMEYSLCLPCWHKSNPKKGKATKDSSRRTYVSKDVTSVIVIGALSYNPAIDSSIVPLDKKNKLHQDLHEIVLDHHIFHSPDGWKRSESMAHPTLRLRLTTNHADYDHIGTACPSVMPSFVTAVTNIGAQSCLWSLQDFYRCGFKDCDLLPVRRTMVAANSEKIKIVGAIFVRMSGVDATGTKHTAPIMAYVSPSTQKLYLSREALIQLGLISRNFPKVGAVVESSAVKCQVAPCGCPTRRLPPKRPQKLPFLACSENVDQMKAWYGERFAMSTFNNCPHQLLHGVTGPCLQLHVDPDALSKPAHTPAIVPLHWQEGVKKQLEDDVALGVLERVPHGEPSKWCHRMVITRKANGGPRRTVDMSSLNKASLRETHHVKPPFQQARSIPPKTWKTVTGAWNGYHSVPLCEDDRHLTTFITHTHHKVHLPVVMDTPLV